jgi:hypothetical protein
VLKKRLFIRVGIPALALVAVGALVLPGASDAATTDTAAASVDKDVAGVGETFTFTSTNPCTTACGLTWYRPDIGLTRFGGVIVGRGEQITLSFDAPGTYPVVLDLSEHCDGTTRLVCHSAALLYVDVVGDPAAPPPAVDPPVVDPPVVDPPVVDPPVVDPPVETTVPPVDTTVPPVDTTLAPVDTTLAPVDTTIAAVDTTLPFVETTLAPVDTTTVDVTPPAASLQASNDVVATTLEGRVRLTWTNPTSTATSLAVERCRGTGCTSFRELAVLDPATESFVESNTRGGSDVYTYRLALSDGNATAYSNAVVLTVRR